MSSGSSGVEEFYTTHSGTEGSVGINRFGKNRLWTDNSGTGMEQGERTRHGLTWFCIVLYIWSDCPWTVIISPVLFLRTEICKFDG